MRSDRSKDISLRTLTCHLWWAIRYTWTVEPWLVSGSAVSALFQSALLPALALVGRNLINAAGVAIGNGDRDSDALMIWLLAGLVVTIAMSANETLYDYIKQRLEDELDRRIATDVISHVSTLDYSVFEKAEFQDTFYQARQTSVHLSGFVAHTLSLITNSVQFLILMVILFMVEPLVFWLLAPIGFGFFLFQWSVARLSFAEDERSTKKYRWTNYYTRLLTEAATVAEAKLYDLAPLFIDRFRSLMTEICHRKRRFHRYGLIGGLAFALVSSLAIYIAFTRVVFKVLADRLTIGDVALYAAVAMRTRGALEGLIRAASGLRSNLLHVSNIRRLLAIQSAARVTGRRRFVHVRGEIECHNVSFTYPKSSWPALSEVSLHIMPGETVALVGENGAGKTTLVKLIARLYDVDEGCILFDNTDIRELSAAHYLRHIAFVLQEFGRYEATAADNVAFGNWRDLMERRDRVVQVARNAGVHELIESMPRRYDTLLGLMFGHHTLSGGQWQKIAIARALARDAALLILDEPTSNLDVRAEYQLFSQFKRMARGRTTILISHRFSTVSMADRILVLERGRIIERGTHTELIDRAGRYAELYALHRRQMGAA